MKEKIILLGGGQHANVVLYNIKEQDKYEVACILERVGIEKNIHGIDVIDDYSDLDKIKQKYKTNKFFIGFGNMRHRRTEYNHFVENGWEAVNIIHPDAVVSKAAQIGKGVLIEAGCLITPNPVIGDNVVVNTGSQINHDNVIENHVYIASGVVLSGGVRIRENTLIDDGVVITLGRSVGSNCIIGAGAVVTKDMPNDIIAYGNPAKVIRENQKSDTVAGKRKGYYENI